MTILGISIGTVRTGVCVLQDGMLIDRQMHEFKDVWSDGKVQLIVNCYRRYIAKRGVSAVIVKIPPRHKLAKPHRLILRRLEALAKKHNCGFDLTTKYEMKHSLSVRSNKELIARAVRLYPELAAVFEKGERNGHCSHKKLFEAIMAAHIYQVRQHTRAQQLASTTE